MSNLTKTSEANSPDQNPINPLKPGQWIGLDCILERPLPWPWLMEPWVARLNGDERESVAGLIPKTVARESAIYAELKAATLRVTSVQHPGILGVRRWVEDANHAAMIAAFDQAKSLADLLQKNERGFFDVAEIKEWVAQLCRALDDAHAAGLVHGWLSVRDLLVTPMSDLLVANFGLTRLLTGAGVPDERLLAAASPQAMSGKAPSAADDIYGLGAIIFELLTGTSIFEAPKIAQKVQEQVPGSMAARRKSCGHNGWEIAPFWEKMVASCLAKDPAQRPARASDIARTLGLRLPAQPITISAPVMSPGGVASKPVIIVPATATKQKTAQTLVPVRGEVIEAKKTAPEKRLIGPVTDEQEPVKSGKGKWALAATLAVFGAAYFLSRNTKTPAPETTTATPSPSVAPSAMPSAAVAEATPEATPTPTLVESTPTATASPLAINPTTPMPSPSATEAVAVLPDNLPSLQPSPSVSATPAPSSSPDQLAFNTTPGPLASASPSTLKTVEPVFTNSLGMKFVPVGDVKFCIWETRVQDFSDFANQTNFKSNLWKQPGFEQGKTHPVVNVSWDDAMAFCKWLTQKDLAAGLIQTNEVYRLPTDLEWSKAAGLPLETGETPEVRDMSIPDVYPWGKQWPPPAGAGNYTGEETGSDVAIRGYSDDFPYTAPVGSFKPNDAGLYDMGGNVWEWCMDFWNAARKYRVLRGGSWYNGALKLSLLTSCRVNAQQGSSTDNFGFRVILAPINSLPPASR